MTSQPQPVPGEVKSAGQYLRPLRDLAAYVLVGANAVFLFLAVVDLIGDGFGYRTQSSFGSFINQVTIGFPLAAVLLALLVQPRHPKAQLIVVSAAVEYAVMALFGIVFGVLIGLINEADTSGARGALEGLLNRVAWLAVFGVAAFAVYQIWRNMFYTPRPKPQPGMYGQPQFNQPGTFPGQPGYGPPPGHPAAPPPGHPAAPPPGPGYPPPPAPGYPPAPGQQGFAPATYGQPAPPWNQPTGQAAATQPVWQAPGAAAQPTSGAAAQPTSGPAAQPASGAPTSAAPAGAGYPPVAEPTQVVPPVAEPTQVVPPVAEPTQVVPPVAEPTQVVPPVPTDDRTQKLSDERPGFGPAADDPPRQ
ncbi:hypothetical protein ODJ79_16715 [Actinoplanes sp. KI2]|uniref:hypothetical protein n=1 Tax=Actinoplanes sp. KI2 TaxID=2983315 RepID=UPI0021D58FDC|nr:hypothetical protein [Actinoplanes sp. KI2]MCU7725370.1 hypothetical protein [Actinoplanes sp. KI2]